MLAATCARSSSGVAVSLHAWPSRPARATARRLERWVRMAPAPLGEVRRSRGETRRVGGVLRLTRSPRRGRRVARRFTRRPVPRTRCSTGPPPRARCRSERSSRRRSPPPPPPAPPPLGKTGPPAGGGARGGGTGVGEGGAGGEPPPPPPPPPHPPPPDPENPYRHPP